ncbi:hypothetical protein ACJJIF_14225 [Microbulbifer sp. SSSA002]|uniref:hypothetical protein n=1 Tax=Microbulbifer sp. SSSA002 TaxID=3243376 RepID=UPI0040393514
MSVGRKVYIFFAAICLIYYAQSINMIYLKILHRLFFLLVFLCISACGGGSSSSKEESNDDSLSLTVQGYVEVGSYTGVEVVFRAGDEVFNADLDTYGNYTVELEIPESEVDSFVYGEAIFPADSGIKLVSALGSFDSLFEISGDDGILVRSELLGVNITSVTTALSALLEIENNGGITSDSQYSAAYKKINSSTMLDIAAYINLSLDRPQEEEFFLPDGVGDIYELATNFNLVSLYILQLRSDFAEEFEMSKRAIFENKKLVNSSPSSFLATEDTYYLPNLNLRLTLRADGTGELVGMMDRVAITWSRTDEGLILEGADIAVNYFYSDYVTENRTRINRMNWVFEGDTVDSVILDLVHYDHYPNGEYQDGSFVEQVSMSSAIRSSAELPVSSTIELGKLYSMPNTVGITEFVELSGELPQWSLVSVLDMRFYGDYETGGKVDIFVPEIYADGNSITTELSGTWSLSGENQLRVEVSSGRSFTYTFLDSEFTDYDWAFVAYESDGRVRAEFDAVFAKEVEGWDKEKVSGIYQIGNYGQSLRLVQDYYWYELNVDGSVSEVYAYDLDLDGDFSESEINVTKGLWQLDENGVVVIRHYSMDGESCIPDVWDPVAGSKCRIDFQRDLDLYSIDESIFYIKKTLTNFSYDSSGEDSDVSNFEGQLLSRVLIYPSKTEKVSVRPLEVPGL